jgi:type I restriction enzyme M protein
MAPHLAEVERLKTEAVTLKDQLTALKKASASDDEIVQCRDQLLAVEKSVRESQAAADLIDAATFDLKAVNPRARVERDERDPIEILDAIEKHGRSVDEALARLRDLTSGVMATEG